MDFLGTPPEMPLEFFQGYVKGTPLENPSEILPKICQVMPL